MKNPMNGSGLKIQNSTLTNSVVTVDVMALQSVHPYSPPCKLSSFVYCDINQDIRTGNPRVMELIFANKLQVQEISVLLTFLFCLLCL